MVGRTGERVTRSVSNSRASWVREQEEESRSRPDCLMLGKSSSSSFCSGLPACLTECYNLFTLTLPTFNVVARATGVREKGVNKRSLCESLVRALSPAHIFPPRLSRSRRARDAAAWMASPPYTLYRKRLSLGLHQTALKNCRGHVRVAFPA